MGAAHEIREMVEALRQTQTEEVDTTPPFDPEAFLSDTLPVRVRDAATLRTEVADVRLAPPEIEADAWWYQPDTPRRTLRSLLPERLDASLRARFDSLPPAAGAAAGDPLEAHRDSIRVAMMPWVALDAARDSLAYQLPYDRLSGSLVEGTPLSVRQMVWPSHARVTSHDRAAISFATEWLDYRRISGNEIRCHAVGDAPHRDDGRALRMAGAYVPTGHGEARIHVRFETRHLSHCQVSPEGLNRLLSYRYDMWIAANRARSSGLRPLLFGR